MKNLIINIYLKNKTFIEKSNGHISDEKYQHSQNVWDAFNFNSFEDFHNHYLKRCIIAS